MNPLCWIGDMYSSTEEWRERKWEAGFQQTSSVEDEDAFSAIWNQSPWPTNWSATVWGPCGIAKIMQGVGVVLAHIICWVRWQCGVHMSMGGLVMLWCVGEGDWVEEGKNGESAEDGRGVPFWWKKWEKFVGKSQIRCLLQPLRKFAHSPNPLIPIVAHHHLLSTNPFKCSIIPIFLSPA